jgi:hypothetical protein
MLSAENQADTMTVADAKRPTVHRYRYPQCVFMSFHESTVSFCDLVCRRMEQHSTHMVPVGTGVDLSDVVVKNDKS